jgi:Ni,Fe-hydrogenase III small subunit
VTGVQTCALPILTLSMRLHTIADTMANSSAKPGLTPDPKIVVAVGACACSGGIFGDTYASSGGIGKLVPVDVYVPGCPPRPEALLYGLLLAVERIGPPSKPSTPRDASSRP